MHIPKASGTAFIAGLTQALDAADATRGFDRVLFGGFTQFDSFSDAARQQVYDSARALPRSAAVIAGHFAYSTLRAAYTGRPVADDPARAGVAADVALGVLAQACERRAG